MENLRRITITINEYQEEAVKTAIYPQEGNTIYPLLGLLDESAEVAEKFYNAINWSKDGKTISFDDILTQSILSGKACGKLKKTIRDTKDEWIHKQLIELSPKTIVESNPVLKNELKKEISDCLWYLAALATDLGLSLDDIAQTNIAKLKDRQARGKLGGSGDSR